VSKTYLGDGAYVDFDGYALVLTTENGISETNRIVLEPEVYEALLGYVARLKGAAPPSARPASERVNAPVPPGAEAPAKSAVASDSGSAPYTAKARTCSACGSSEITRNGDRMLCVPCGNEWTALAPDAAKEPGT
jgi:ribosomal protein S27AE